MVRHAKSDWSDPATSDYNRTLNKRGLFDAPLMAGKFIELGFIPDRVISSSANRAYTTSKIICEVMGFDPEKIEQTKTLYLASSFTILKMINSFNNKWQSIMLFGHNPGLTELTESLSGVSIGNLPTCALVAIEFKMDDWKQISGGTGTLKAFEYPKKYK